jgi:hypothetical protein
LFCGVDHCWNNDGHGLLLREDGRRNADHVW